MDEYEKKYLVDKAVLGKQVESFLNSDIGEFLLEKANKDYVKAIQQLRDCSHKDLLQYQSDMKRAESIKDWLIEAVEEGIRALNILDGQEEELE